ncbi:MAG TPA: complex I NDUFA9 subunit family protein, partial [Rhodocyclaceae bacterium]|nr:complex I NDUFA9 subunit family protein [Rhodocyclaceae bacterium]
MEIRSILLLGGSGFIGSHLARRLSEQDFLVVIPTRRAERAKHLTLLPTVEVIEADVHDQKVLSDLASSADTIINLIGILHSKSGVPYGPDFAQAHVALPQKIAMACNDTAVQRLIHVSALGAANDAPSEYLRSKADGEAAIQKAHAAWTIFRPSVVFGPDDKFLNVFAQLLHTFPILPLGGARARFQPVFVEDVVSAIVSSLTLSASFGHTYELAGPKIYSLLDLVHYVAELIGRPRLIVPLPDGLAMLEAAILECLPGPLMNRDNMRSMQIDSIASGI